MRVGYFDWMGEEESGWGGGKELGSMDFFATGCEVGKGVEFGGLGDCEGTFLVVCIEGGVNVMTLFIVRVYKKAV